MCEPLLVGVADRLGDAAEQLEPGEPVGIGVLLDPVVEPYRLRVVGVDRGWSARVGREIAGGLDASVADPLQQAELPFGGPLQSVAFGVVGCTVVQMESDPLVDACRPVGGAVVLPVSPSSSSSTRR